MYAGRPSAYIMDFEMRVKAFNLTKLTKGKGPVARFAHQACSISKGRYLLISRWNHSLIALDDDKLVIFGGLNMTTYMNSSNL